MIPRNPKEVSITTTRDTLDRLVDLISQSGNPDKDFFYLGGPMSGIPAFNFPRFHSVGKKLRAKGYNIVSPAELDDPELVDEILASPDGDAFKLSRSHEDLLGRDLIVVSLPTCVGMICLPGWENSLGAAGESWVTAFLGKQLYAYDEFEDGAPILRAIERDEELEALHADLVFDTGTLPRQKPGESTTLAMAEVQSA